jgi:hypothetical protein
MATDVIVNDLKDLAQADPSLSMEALALAEKPTRTELVNWVLKVPRLRPLPFLHLADGGMYAQEGDKIEDSHGLDTYNHDENNWWCKIKPSPLQEAVYKVAAVTPQGDWHLMRHGAFGLKVVDEYYSTPDEQNKARLLFEPFLKQQRGLLENHPYQAHISASELARLEALPNAAGVLIGEVLEREKAGKWWNFWKSSGEPLDPLAQAAALSRGITVTRYSCQQDGSYASISRSAYKILQSTYKDSDWAKQTPYWFGCKHFRDDVSCKGR